MTQYRNENEREERKWTYEILAIANGLADNKKDSEEAGENGIQSAQDDSGDDPFLRCETDEFLAAIITGRDEDGHLRDLQLHVGDESVGNNWKEVREKKERCEWVG